MKTLDIERLLSWTYIDELPKQGVNSSCSGGVSMGFSALGTVVDGGFRQEPGFPAAAGAPHPDALTVAVAVGDLPSVGVDWAESREWIMGPLAALVAVDDRRMRLATFSPKALVIRAAVFRQGPDWGRSRTEWPRPRRILGRNGRPVVDGVTPKGYYPIGSLCPVEYRPDPREIAEERMEYAVWRAALVMLVERLDGALEEHRATGPVAPLQPWVTGESAPGRILPVAPTWSNSKFEPIGKGRRRRKRVA